MASAFRLDELDNHVALLTLDLPEKDRPDWRHSFTLRGLNKLPAVWHQE